MKTRKEKFDDDELSRYLMRHSTHGIEPFLNIVPKLSPGQYWKFLRDIWMNVEVIQPDQRTWLRLFQSKKTNRKCLMLAEEHEKLAELPDSIEIWRGCGELSGVRGMSWTLDRKIAEYFSAYAVGQRRRMLAHIWPEANVKPFVVRAKCQKTDVIAYFEERQEKEIVVDPKFVTNLRKYPASKKVKYPWKSDVLQRLSVNPAKGDGA